MFTGIVEKKTQIIGLDGYKLSISNPFSISDLKAGMSLSILGSCLTVVDFSSKTLTFDLSPETQQRTKFGKLKKGEFVNIERSLKLGGSLDGHWVTGHIDSVGNVRSLEIVQEGMKKIWVDVEKRYLPWLVEKGSIAMDGVSLTVNDLDEKGFSVMIIPHTWKMTSLESLLEGSTVNLEFDLLAKYVERLLKFKNLEKGLS